MEAAAPEARAFWLREPGSGEIRSVTLPDVASGEVRVRTLWSGISRGTESLVFRGRVPAAEHERMRAPHQEGSFPAPVKYGYLNVGVVEEGDAAMVGRRVFCLFPHQTEYVVPGSAVAAVPDGVPPRRAVLAGTVETAVNAVWDAAPLLGDRVAVIGAGMVGCCVARLLAGVCGVEVTLVDVDEDRASVAERLGVPFRSPREAQQLQGRCDRVVHASATSEGLRLALELLAPTGSVVELSWYGDEDVAVGLGGVFHSRVLAIRGSQVGTVAHPRRTARERLELALTLLKDPAFEALITAECSFEDLPRVMPRIAEGSLPGLLHLVNYGGD